MERLTDPANHTCKWHFHVLGIARRHGLDHVVRHIQERRIAVLGGEIILGEHQPAECILIKQPATVDVHRGVNGVDDA
jgi:hypothetical protein